MSGSRWIEQKNTVVRCRFELVGTCVDSHGNKAAAAYAEELAQRDEENLERVYSLLGSVIQVILAMGFFGTVWGISRSMFTSFTNLNTASADELKQGLGLFTQALSTALDTTVLALVCGIIASIAVTTMRWAEVGSLEDLTDRVKQHFGLEVAMWCEDQESKRDQGAALLEAVRQGLKDLVGEAAAAFRKEISRATGEHLGSFQQHQREASAASGEVLREAGERSVPEGSIGCVSDGPPEVKNADGAPAPLEEATQAKDLLPEVTEPLNGDEQPSDRERRQ